MNTTKARRKLERGTLVRACTGLVWPILLISTPVMAQHTFDGSVELQHRVFIESASSMPNTAVISEPSNTTRSQTSASVSLDYFNEWNDGDDRIEVETFARIDSLDAERSHVDLRQFLWTHYGNNYEFSAGIGRVFWGVTETQHLVDIINQTDFVENIDGEDKLGQPMLRYQHFTNFGTFEGFVLPYFRERTFEGKDGRLSGGILVNGDQALYESNDGENNIDLALRYANSLGPFDLGLSWFSGTSREPDLRTRFNPASLSTQPFYPKTDQYGIDIQATLGGWLLKLESIQRNFKSPVYEDYVAATIGAEYTLVGILGTPYDIGLLSEYSWDERGEQSGTLFQDDLFIGARLTLNDVASSELLFGISGDLTYSGSKAVFIEGSTRLSNSLSLNIEARYFTADTPQDPLFRFNDSSFIQLGLEFFFD